MSSAAVSGQVVLTQLGSVLRSEGGLLAAVLIDPPAVVDARFGELVQQGPQVAPRAAQYALVVEAVREGYLLHYGVPRILHTDDPDLALLAGDRLYALGIERLAELNDPYAVARLAELIGQCAQVHSMETEGERTDELWEAAVRAIGWDTR